MRKKKGTQVGLRLDSHVIDCISRMPGDNDAEKLRQLLTYGIEYRDALREMFKKSIDTSSSIEAGGK